MAKAFKRVFPVLLISLMPFLVRGQLPLQRAVDSLQALVSTAKIDTVKILLLSKLSSVYFTIDNNKGVELGIQALNMAKKLGYKTGLFKANYALGSNYWAKYDFIQAQDYYGSALKIAEEAGNKRRITACLRSIGICYQAENNFPQAIAYYKKELAIDEHSGQKDEIEGDRTSLANVYISQSKYNDALEIFKESLKIAQLSKNKQTIAYCTRRIGDIYAELGNLSEALKWGKRSIQLYIKLNDYDAEAGAVHALGDTYAQFGKYPEAISQYKNVLDLLDEQRNNTAKGTATIGSKADLYFDLADAYSRLGGLSESAAPPPRKTTINTNLTELALQNFNKSLALAKSKGYIENIAKTLKKISDIQNALGRFDSALKTYKEYVVYRDSADNLQKDREYKQHELAFEYSKKRDSLNYAEKLQQKEIAQVRTSAANKVKQHSLYAIVVIVLLLFIASYFVFRAQIQKIGFKNQLANEKAQLELKQALFEKKVNDLTLTSLKAQMNPHFIFNCLNSIKFYVENNETDAASVYITKFSKLIRSILDSAQSEKITLSEEIELIKLYLEMEGMRLKHRLSYELVVDDNIECDFIEIPPLLIQPYIENAIWHGIMNKSEGGFVKLTISAAPNQRYLVINITDNGVGRKRSAEIKSNNFLQHASQGTKLNNERIEIFNAKYKTKTEVTITDLYDGSNKPCGTSVTIKLLTT